MSNYLTDKQLAKKNEGYNPSRAGEQIMSFCETVRADLMGKLVKPIIDDTSAFESYIAAKVAIKNMGYNELLSASRTALWSK